MTINCRCGETITGEGYQAFLAMQAHRKFCSPKRKTRAQLAAEKRDQLDEDNAVGSRPLRHQSYTGRMWLQSMEKIQSLLRIEAEHAPEDARAVAAMVNEGGRP